MDTGKREHWDRVYESKKATEVSWYRSHLDVSLDLVARVAPDRKSAIIDVGGGAATLVDDLLGRGYEDVTVLDISASALDVARARLGDAATRVKWLSGDVTTVELPEAWYDVWHDRAVFHFLTESAQRSAYVRQVRRSVREGGHVIVGTFGPEGPLQCSGLDVVRYDADSLHEQFGAGFELVERKEEVHQTPLGRQQQFVWCVCRRVGHGSGTRG